MSPLHHHFELGGWPETKVTTRFWSRRRWYSSLAGVAVRAMTARRVRRDERVLVIGLGRSGRASVAVLRRARRRRVWRPTRSRRPSWRRRCAEVEARRRAVRRARRARRVLAEVDVAVLSPGIPLNADLVRRIQAARVPVFSEIEVAYRICRRRSSRSPEPKGRRRRRRSSARCSAQAGFTTYVGGNIGNALIAETARTRPRGLGDRRGVVVPARVDPLVQAAHRDDHQHLARPPRPLSLDGRVRRSEVPHLREPGPGRHVRRQPRRPDRRRARRGGSASSRDPRARRCGTRASRTALTDALRAQRARSSTRRRPAIRGRSTSCRSMRSRCSAPQRRQRDGRASSSALPPGIEPRRVRATGVRGFAPLPHRLEPSRSAAASLYVDDSKATNPGAVDRRAATRSSGRSC